MLNGESVVCGLMLVRETLRSWATTAGHLATDGDSVTQLIVSNIVA